jgi:hypothetical protein
VAFTGGVLPAAGAPADLWVVRIDAAGGIVWQKRYGGDLGDAGVAIRQTRDGGYVVAGDTRSYGAGSADVWVLRLDAAGSVLWQRAYGGPDDDRVVGLLALDEGGFILAGSRGVAEPGAWIARLDAAGGVVWEAVYGGGGRTTVRALAAAAAGGFVLAGDMSDAAAFSDFFAARIGADGSLLWQHAYATDSPYQDEGYGLAPAAGGGYFLSGGSAWSEGFELVDSTATLLRLDAGGRISADCGFIRATGRMATPVASAVTATTAAPADTGASVLAAPFTPAAVESRVTERCFGLLPPVEVAGPGAARPLVLMDDVTVAWEPAEASGACAFNLYRGAIVDLRNGSYGACLAAGLTTATATDGDMPAPGEGFAYLVTGRNGAGEGPAGADSAGLPRIPPAACP